MLNGRKAALASRAPQNSELEDGQRGSYAKEDTGHSKTIHVEKKPRNSSVYMA